MKRQRLIKADGQRHQTKKHTWHRQTVSQTGRQTANIGRLANRRKDEQTDRQKDGKTDR